LVPSTVASSKPTVLQRSHAILHRAHEIALCHPDVFAVSPDGGALTLSRKRSVDHLIEQPPRVNTLPVRTPIPPPPVRATISPAAPAFAMPGVPAALFMSSNIPGVPAELFAGGRSEPSWMTMLMQQQQEQDYSLFSAPNPLLPANK